MLTKQQKLLEIQNIIPKLNNELYYRIYKIIKLENINLTYTLRCILINLSLCSDDTIERIHNLIFT